MDYTEEIQLLAKGEDFLARLAICQQLQHIIDQSEIGEIGLADFTEQLLAITADCKMLSEQPWDIKNKLIK